MSEKRKIIFANQSSGSLMLDIVNAFSSSGQFDKVILFTGEINIRPTKPVKSVIIHKTLKYNRKNVLTRFFTWIITFFHLLIFAAIKSKHYELFLVSNPPLNVFIPFFLKNKFSILIYDIYPDSLVAQNVFNKDSWIIRQWEKANVKAYCKAKQVFTISNDMKLVLEKYVSGEKIQVIYNWIHPLEIVDRGRNQFLKHQNLTEKFIVLYSGNMGMTHDLDVMVDVANLLRNHDDVVFVFIGEGGKKKLILKKIEKLSLSNCLVLPYQPNEMLAQTMGGADLGIVTLDSGSDALSIPSKTNRFLALGVPLLCIANKKSELSRIVEGNQVGESFSKNELHEMAEFIKYLRDNKSKHNTFKQRAYELSKNYTPKNAELFLGYLNNIEN